MMRHHPVDIHYEMHLKPKTYLCHIGRQTIPSEYNKMKKKMFVENVRMETETEFFENGDINVHPCAFEMGRVCLTHESKVSYRGRITVMENGSTNVKAYHMGTQSPMYTKLYETEHCDVLRTRSGKIIERWRFSPKVPIHRIWEIRKQETPQVDAFFLTLK